MATRRQFMKRATELGVTLDENMDPCFNLDVPQGKRFAGSGLHMIPFCMDDTWRKADMYDFYIEEMRLGLEDCPVSDCDYCNDI